MSKESSINSELSHILSKLHSAQRGVERIEQGKNMRTIKQNISFLIDGIEEWKEINKETV